MIIISMTNIIIGSRTQRVGLWTVCKTHIFKKKHHKYIAKRYTFEQPMPQKNHQKQAPIKNTKLNKIMGTNNEGDIQ